jgi:hypothetical protein
MSDDTEPTTDAFTEAVEERAAIMEFDGGVPRAEAERLALLVTPRPLLSQIERPEVLEKWRRFASMTPRQHRRARRLHEGR